MAFRKRNVGISQASQDTSASDSTSLAPQITRKIPGVRPSPIDGRLVTSTGTPSLDNLLAGHGGLALGNSILIGENGTTDYAGALVKYFAAEGVVQGHMVHVLGMPEGWGRELPGVTGEETSERRRDDKKDKMKIAWRYEGLGEFGKGPADRRASAAVDRSPTSHDTSSPTEATSFCHVFDLTKRLAHSDISNVAYIAVSHKASTSPFDPILQHLSASLASSPPQTVHRLVVPTLLSPALYPPNASQPAHLLAFAHALRSLLRQYATKLTAFITLPLSLYPRSTGLVRWMEHLLDGVLELTPFPHSSSSALSTSGASTSQEEKPQGLLAIHKLPVFHERGGGGGPAGVRVLGEDLAFTVSRKKFEIRPFSLPPAEGDNTAQEAREVIAKGDAKSMEF